MTLCWPPSASGISSLNLVALQWFSRWRADRNRAIEQIRGRLLAGVMWAIQIIESIKATGSESDLLVRWTGDQARMISAEQALGFCDTLLLVLPPLLASLTAIVVLGLGGRQVIFGGLSIGVLVAFQSLLAEFQPAVPAIWRGWGPRSRSSGRPRPHRRRSQPADRPGLHAIAGRRRLGEAGWSGGRNRASRPQRLSGHLEFRRVTFGYNRTVEEPLIKEFSFVARPGQRIALVGSSGSGKSTIGRLAAGLYQPWSGEILYDGKPLARDPREVFVNSVELVDSEICLFEGSVRDNLTSLGRNGPAGPARSRPASTRRSTATCFSGAEDTARPSPSRAGISPAASASGCRSPGPWCVIPAS